MAEEDYGYGEGDVDEDFDQIEYRPPQAGAAAKAPPGNAHIAEPTGLNNKRVRCSENEHHVDVNTPGGNNAPGPVDVKDPPNNSYYGSYQQPASKRAAAGAQGSQYAVLNPYDSHNGGGNNGAHNNGAYNSSGNNGAPYNPYVDNQGGAGAGGNVNSPGANAQANGPMCQCREPCIRRVSNSEKNPGRPFYKCAKPPDTQCRFFKWEDELDAGDGGGASRGAAGAYGYGGGAGGGGAYGSGNTGAYGGNPYAANPYASSQAASTSGPTSNPYNTQPGGGATYGGGGSGAYGGGGPGAYGGGGGGAYDGAPPAGPVPEGADIVKCHCGVPCPVKTSNSANNPGREFFACPKARDDATRCRFFQWADEVGSGGGAGGGGGGMGGAGGGGTQAGNCYICNQPGHFASSCPQKAAGGGGGGGFSGRSTYGGGGGGGASGGAPCYLCNQTGHWARDCPSKQGGGGGGYGGRGGGGGGGPPQSFASRFNRDGGGGGGGGYGGGGYGGGGGGGGGKGNCYKCGQPGHWASSCPNSR